MRRTYLLGTPGDACRGIEAYLAAGVRHLVIGCAPGAHDQLGAFMSAMGSVLVDVRAEHRATPEGST